MARKLKEAKQIATAQVAKPLSKLLMEEREMRIKSCGDEVEKVLKKYLCTLVAEIMISGTSLSSRVSVAVIKED